MKRSQTQQQAPASTRERRPQSQNQPRQQQGTRRPLPAVSSTSRELVKVEQVPFVEKIKYTAASTFATGVITGILGAHSFSAVLALGAGIVTWHSAERIYVSWQKRDGRPTWSRPAWTTWKWWTSPRSIRQPGTPQDQAEPVDPDARQEAEELERQFFNRQKEPPPEDCANLGHDLYPPIDTFLSQRVAVLGTSGSGKSNTVAVLIEELGRYRIPLLVLDTEGEYSPLCTRRYLRFNPLHADANTVNIGNAYSFGRRIMDECLQVVLNLDSFENDSQAAAVMIEIIRGIREWEEELSNEERVPCTVILDEAQVWLPENESESMVSRVKDPKTKLSLLDILQQTFFNVVRRGRKRGIGFIFATQKLAEIDNRCLQVHWGIYHRQDDDTSLARYAKLGINRDIAQSLKRGEAWIKHVDLGISGTYQIRRRRSPHGAHAPGLAAARARYRTENLLSSVSRSGNASGGGNGPETAGGNGPETNGDANSKIIRPPFTTIEGSVSSNSPFPGVETPAETGTWETGGLRETIRRMKESGMADRKVAALVGLSGRKYHIYQQICRELGYSTEQQSAEEAK